MSQGVSRGLPSCKDEKVNGEVMAKVEGEEERIDQMEVEQLIEVKDAKLYNFEDIRFKAVGLKFSEEPTQLEELEQSFEILIEDSEVDKFSDIYFESLFW